MGSLPELSLLRFYVRDGLANCLNLFCFFVWNGYVKFFFKFHDQLNCIQ